MKATLFTKRTGTLIFALLLLASCSGEKEISGDTAKNNTDTDAPVPMETEETRMYATLPADLSFADEDFYISRRRDRLSVRLLFHHRSLDGE